MFVIILYFKLKIFNFFKFILSKESIDVIFALSKLRISRFSKFIFAKTFISFSLFLLKSNSFNSCKSNSFK